MVPGPHAVLAAPSSCRDNDVPASTSESHGTLLTTQAPVLMCVLSVALDQEAEPAVDWVDYLDTFFHSQPAENLRRPRGFADLVPPASGEDAARALKAILGPRGTALWGSSAPSKTGHGLQEPLRRQGRGPHRDDQARCPDPPELAVTKGGLPRLTRPRTAPRRASRPRHDGSTPSRGHGGPPALQLGRSAHTSHHGTVYYIRPNHVRGRYDRASVVASSLTVPAVGGSVQVKFPPAAVHIAWSRDDLI